MSSRIPADMRRLVEQRADLICEYCLIHADNVYVGLQVDHVISEKQGGQTVAGNLALACASCNRAKGSDIAALNQISGTLIRLFNPRMDRWGQHFRLVGARIEWRTAEGEATVRLLQLNTPERIAERESLRQQGKFPSGAALERMRSS